jgi:cytochrome bd-type quinol oxidase subunit 2
MDVTTAAAVLFAVVLTGVVAFQVALAVGAPWGAYAMAGAFPGRYPPAMRIAAFGQGVVLALVGVVVLSAARVIAPEVVENLPWLIWVAVAISGASLVLNVITPNAAERRIWVPVALTMLVCSLTVAITA